MIENSAGWRYVQSADSVADYPTVSEHNAGKFQDLKSIVDGKAPLTHTHPQSQVTGLDAALAGKAPLTHTHPQSQVTGLDAALAGKAPLTHTHPQSQVTGLDAALDGKAPLSTLNTRIPENLALRLDTTVGTRIFAGTTMIQGDTDWRNIAGSMINGWKGNLYLRRINNIVYLRGSVIAATATAGYPITLLPGFRPGILTGSAGNDYGAALVFTTGSSTSVKSVSCYFDRFTIAGYASADTYMVNVSWPTSNSWPSSLPGLPV